MFFKPLTIINEGIFTYGICGFLNITENLEEEKRQWTKFRVMLLSA